MLMMRRQIHTELMAFTRSRFRLAVAFATPAESHQRLAYFLPQSRGRLTPDTGDTELELEDCSFSQLPVGTLQPLPCVHLSSLV